MSTHRYTHIPPVKTAASCLVVALLACAGTASATAHGHATGKQVEKLNRGVVAIATPSGPFISWRLLATDEPGTMFNVYRDKTKINSAPLHELNWSDTGGNAASVYTVRPVVNGVEHNASKGAATWAAQYKRLPVQRPDGGTTPNGVAYTYEINDGTPADLDGDGSYDVIIKWQPSNAKDNSQSGYTGNT